MGDQLRAARKDFDGAKHLNETLAAEVEGLIGCVY